MLLAAAAGGACAMCVVEAHVDGLARGVSFAVLNVLCVLRFFSDGAVTLARVAGLTSALIKNTSSSAFLVLSAYIFSTPVEHRIFVQKGGIDACVAALNDVPAKAIEAAGILTRLYLTEGSF
jgi:hypothetical protein